MSIGKYPFDLNAKTSGGKIYDFRLNAKDENGNPITFSAILGSHPRKSAGGYSKLINKIIKLTTPKRP